MVSRAHSPCRVYPTFFPWTWQFRELHHWGLLLHEWVLKVLYLKQISYLESKRFWYRASNIDKRDGRWGSGQGGKIRECEKAVSEWEWKKSLYWQMLTCWQFNGEKVIWRTEYINTCFTESNEKLKYYWGFKGNKLKCMDSKVSLVPCLDFFGILDINLYSLKTLYPLKNHIWLLKGIMYFFGTLKINSSALFCLCKVGFRPSPAPYRAMHCV